jgi:hypothetical protein
MAPEAAELQQSQKSEQRPENAPLHLQLSCVSGKDRDGGTITSTRGTGPVTCKGRAGQDWPKRASAQVP